MPSNKKPRLIGVLLAAGRCRRMNGAKQFEPWTSAKGTRPLVAASFDAVNIVCDEMIVVLGHRAEEVANLLGKRSFIRTESDPDAPMFDSICTGLQAAQDLDAGATVLLHPGDHPEVAPATLHRLIEVSQQGHRPSRTPRVPWPWWASRLDPSSHIATHFSNRVPRWTRKVLERPS